MITPSMDTVDDAYRQGYLDAKRMDKISQPRRVNPRHIGGIKTVALRFKTRTEFLAWLDKQVEAGEVTEFGKDRQVERSKLIGEIGLLTKAVLVNNNPHNPCWEGEFTGPGNERKLKIILWPEDMSCMTTDRDRWAFYTEITDTNPTDAPDGWNPEFIIGMDTNMDYRAADKVREEVQA